MLLFHRKQYWETGTGKDQILNPIELKKYKQYSFQSYNERNLVPDLALAGIVSALTEKRLRKFIFCN